MRVSMPLLLGAVSIAVPVWWHLDWEPWFHGDRQHWQGLSSVGGTDVWAWTLWLTGRHQQGHFVTDCFTMWEPGQYGQYWIGCSKAHLFSLIPNSWKCVFGVYWNGIQSFCTKYYIIFSITNYKYNHRQILWQFYSNRLHKFSNLIIKNHSD